LFDYNLEPSTKVLEKFKLKVVNLPYNLDHDGPSEVVNLPYNLDHDGPSEVINLPYNLDHDGPSDVVKDRQYNAKRKRTKRQTMVHISRKMKV
jgi:hypothetical protein